MFDFIEAAIRRGVQYDGDCRYLDGFVADAAWSKTFTLEFKRLVL